MQIPPARARGPRGALRSIPNTAVWSAPATPAPAPGATDRLSALSTEGSERGAAGPTTPAPLRDAATTARARDPRGQTDRAGDSPRAGEPPGCPEPRPCRRGCPAASCGLGSGRTPPALCLALVITLWPEPGAPPTGTPSEVSTPKPGAAGGGKFSDYIYCCLHMCWNVLLSPNWLQLAPLIIG